MQHRLYRANTGQTVSHRQPTEASVKYK